MKRGVFIGLGLLGIVPGCPDAGYFVCSSNAECTETTGGRCEPSGACSFPDLACPTGRRYGQAGNPNIAGQCVPPGDIGGTGTEPTSDSGAQGDSETTSAVGASGTDGSSSAGGNVDGSSTGQQGGTTGSGTGEGTASQGDGASESSESTGDPGPALDMFESCEQPMDCTSGTCAFFVEPGTLDPLGNFCSDIGCSDPETDCLDVGTQAARTCVQVPVNGVLESICALDCTDTGASGCAAGMICLGNIIGLPGMCAHSE